MKHNNIACVYMCVNVAWPVPTACVETGYSPLRCMVGDWGGGPPGMYVTKFSMATDSRTGSLTIAVCLLYPSSLACAYHVAATAFFSHPLIDIHESRPIINILSFFTSVLVIVLPIVSYRTVS